MGEKRYELVLAEIQVQPKYPGENGKTQKKILEDANKQALIDLFRHAANRLEGADLFWFDFTFLNEIAIDLLVHKWDSKLQITLRSLKPEPSTGL